MISSAIEVALLVLNGSKDCPDHVLAEDGPMQDKDKWSAITLNISQTPPRCSHYYLCLASLPTILSSQLVEISAILASVQKCILIFSGIFFVLPCIESYQKVDLRTITLGVPPQEVINP